MRAQFNLWAQCANTSLLRLKICAMSFITVNEGVRIFAVVLKTTIHTVSENEYGPIADI